MISLGSNDFLHINSANSNASFIPNSFLKVLKSGIAHAELYSYLLASVTVVIYIFGRVFPGKALVKT
jgi:hypothetical protein